MYTGSSLIDRLLAYTYTYSHTDKDKLQHTHTHIQKVTESLTKAHTETRECIHAVWEVSTSKLKRMRWTNKKYLSGGWKGGCQTRKSGRFGCLNPEFGHHERIPKPKTECSISVWCILRAQLTCIIYDECSVCEMACRYTFFIGNSIFDSGFLSYFRKCPRNWANLLTAQKGLNVSSWPELSFRAIIFRNVRWNIGKISGSDPKKLLIKKNV